MKVAVLTICYNEAEWIGKCVDQFKPWSLRHLVLVSTKPWNGVPKPYDGTAQVAEQRGAEVIVGYWPTEHEQRNYGLALLRDYDWVLIVDGDEFYDPDDIDYFLKRLGDTPYPAARTNNVITYWKTPEYRLEPKDTHEPVIAAKPKQVAFSEHRQLRQFKDFVPEMSQELIEIPLHHMSWAKSSEKVSEKIESFSHAEDIKPGWFEDVWTTWTPDKDDLRPYGQEKSKAIYDPCPISSLTPRKMLS